jgi:hypothetical protein
VIATARADLTPQSNARKPCSIEPALGLIRLIGGNRNIPLPLIAVSQRTVIQFLNSYKPRAFAHAALTAPDSGPEGYRITTPINEIGLRQMEGLVLQVYTVVVGAAGSLMSAGFMPLAFENESEAFAYMDGYIASVFRFGKSGYNEVEEFWWGCEAGPELQLHRYRLEMRCTAADLTGIPADTCDIDVVGDDSRGAPSVH